MTSICRFIKIESCCVKLIRSAVIYLIVALVSNKATFAGNILGNAGFESGDFADWTTFGVYNSVQSGVPHTGNYYYKVYGQFNGSYNFTGLYQEIPSAPGNTYEADGWTYSLSSDGGGIHGQDLIWLEVSFRDASDNALALYRSDVVNGFNIARYGGLDTWFDLQITNQCSFTNATDQILFPGTVTNTATDLVAPAATAYVRYQIVFEQGPDNANGSMYFDDLTLDQTGGTVVSTPATQWNIVWDDEFNGNSLDTSKWTYDTGNGFYSGNYYVSGWGNKELENYTSRTQNVYVANGLLHIHAQQEAYGGQNYTSGRIKSMGLFFKEYGRFEWRARLPAGTGFWPALWMLPENSPYGGWPNSGEIDVMENNGDTPNEEGGTIHYGGSNGNDVYSGQTYTFPNGDSVTNFHTYTLEWTTNKINWYVDGHLYETQTNWWSNIGTSSDTYPYPAPFDQPFYIIMNLAIGGNYLGNPGTNLINASLPGEMEVDYVRVYEQTAPLQISVSRSNNDIVLSWPTNIVCHLQMLTNSLDGTNWLDVESTTNPFLIKSDSSNRDAFFRLQSP
jgi:beta-glucanase (GH16 family)